jgi:hypothetical protein
MGMKSEICYLCKKEVNDLAANPSLWKVNLPYKDGKGKTRTICMQCIINAVEYFEEYNLGKEI